jgi:Short C-terminal domain
VLTTGLCLVGIGLVVVLARRLIGDAVVNSLVKVPSDKPAVHQVFRIGTSLLYDSAIALITYGAVIVVAAWIAGSTRPALVLRRALAPSLREHVNYVYAVAGLALLLLVIWGPFPSTRQPLPVIGIAVVLVLGIQALRRMTAREFPDTKMGDAARACRDWLVARRDSAVAALSPAHAAPAPGAEQNDRIADLERLASLHHSGDLTDEEFRAHKAALLSPHS